MNPPFYYDYNNAVISVVSPNTLHVRNTCLAQYFTKYLLQKIMSRYKWNVPDNWDVDFLQSCILETGFSVVFDSKKFGVIPQFGTLSNYNVFYRPSMALVANPLLPDIRELKIGADCTIIKMQPNYSGVMDIVSYYADLMALCAETATTNIYNSKLSYIFYAKNKAQAETLKKAYDKATSGDPAVVIDLDAAKTEGMRNWEPFAPGLKEHYIAGDILDDMLKIVRMFETDVGIPNSNTEKKERLVSDEVNSNNVSVYSKASLWLDTMKAGAEEVNKMFYGGEKKVSVDWRSGPYESDAINFGDLLGRTDAIR